MDPHSRNAAYAGPSTSPALYPRERAIPNVATQSPSRRRSRDRSPVEGLAVA